MLGRIWISLGAFVLVSAATRAGALSAELWSDRSKSPDTRARSAVAAMTFEEKLSLLHGQLALPFLGKMMPAGVIPAAGFVPGVPRLGIPSLTETDASLGVVNPGGIRPGDTATALPSSLALASSFDPALAYRAGVLLGREAHSKGFDVLLGGGINLARDPRNGRNFEYLGEDPLLAGLLAGEQIRGAQDQHVVSTIKHFAINANETNRMTLDARIDPEAARESDLLAFQVAIERGRPGAVMCSYNLVNGSYACANDWLLNQVLKRDWKYPGWIMSDWGAVHAATDAIHGLDQESGEQLDREVYFDAPLRQAVASQSVPAKRIDDMVFRILRSLFEVGVVDDPPKLSSIDVTQGAAVALTEEEEGAVLLKNEGQLLPLHDALRRIAVIGGHAQIGVLSGGGSSQVTPSNGQPIKLPIGGQGFMAEFRAAVYFPSSPMKAIQSAAGKAEILYDNGDFPADAAALAARADVALVFVTRHEMEGYDVPNLKLPNGQDELVEAVAAANPRTVVVLETGNPVAMPWLDRVGAVIAAWYPGQEGGPALANILFGKVNPSGRLPMSLLIDEAQAVRPRLPNHGSEPDAWVSIDYTEGSNIGYRWYGAHNVKLRFPFGYGLSYTRFQYSNLKINPGAIPSVSLDVENAGARAGADVPQIYLTSLAGAACERLIAFQRIEMQPGEKRRVTFSLDLRFLGHFNSSAHRFIVPPGRYQISAGHSSQDLELQGSFLMRRTTI